MTVEIVRHQIRQKNIHLVVEIEPIPTVWCNPGRLNQVLLNLLVNAVQAVDAGSTITIRTHHLPEIGRVSVRYLGQRARHPRVDSRQDLRPLLHHQTARRRHRAGPLDRLQHRRRTPRPDRGRLRTSASAPPSPSPSPPITPTSRVEQRSRWMTDPGLRRTLDAPIENLHQSNLESKPRSGRLSTTPSNPEGDSP